MKKAIHTLNRIDEDLIKMKQQELNIKEKQVDNERIANTDIRTTIILTIAIIGFFIFVSIILSSTITAEIQCSGTGINYEKIEYIGVTSLDNENLILNNSNISCTGKIDMPTWIVTMS